MRSRTCNLIPLGAYTAASPSVWVDTISQCSRKTPLSTDKRSAPLVKALLHPVQLLERLTTTQYLPCYRRSLGIVARTSGLPYSPQLSACAHRYRDHGKSNSANYHQSRAKVLAAGHDTHHPIGARRRDVPAGKDTVVLLLCVDSPVVAGATDLAH
jgi:hypothetical protein